LARGDNLASNVSFNAISIDFFLQLIFTEDFIWFLVINEKSVSGSWSAIPVAWQCVSLDTDIHQL
jgi:hypothetical protein